MPAGHYVFDGVDRWQSMNRFLGDVLVTAAPPENWVKPIIGIAEGPYETSFAPINQRMVDAGSGPFLARRSYASWPLPASFPASVAGSDVAAGRHTYFSFKPTTPVNGPSAFLNSVSQQNSLRSFLATIPAGHPTTIIAWHEPEDNMSDFPDIHAWGAMQNMVADIVHESGRPELRFGPCFMGPYTWDTTSSYYQWIDDWKVVMDWDKFDVIGIDPYATIYPDTRSLQRMLTYNNSGSSSTNQSTAMFTFLQQFDIPIALCEWGYFRKQAQDHSNAQSPVNPIPEAEVARWIGEAYAWMKEWNQAHPRRIEGGRVRGAYIEAAMWFNYTLQGSDCPLDGAVNGDPADYPAKIAAYAAILADSKIPVAEGA